MSVVEAEDGMRMEIITGVERRRRWPVSEKLRIVAETEAPGVCFAEVARRHEMSRGLLWTWRRQVRLGLLRADAPPLFVPLRILDDQVAARPAAPVAIGEHPSVPAPGLKPAGAMEIDLGGDRRIRVDRDVDARALRRVLDVLARR